MAVPKKKRSLRIRRVRRNLNKGNPITSIVRCTNCQSYKKLHYVCFVCGSLK